MTLRTGVYIVPTHRWYIERTVWLIAGIVLLTSTGLALLVNPLSNSRRHRDWICLHQCLADRFLPGSAMRSNCSALHRCWGQMHRRAGIYLPYKPIAGISSGKSILAVEINISVASILILSYSAWWALFTVFVGGAMVWFAATGYCVMANMLFWLGSEPRLNPEALPSGRCANCALSPVCVSSHARHA